MISLTRPRDVWLVLTGKAVAIPTPRQRLYQDVALPMMMSRGVEIKNNRIVVHGPTIELGEVQEAGPPTNWEPY